MTSRCNSNNSASWHKLRAAGAQIVDYSYSPCSQRRVLNHLRRIAAEEASSSTVIELGTIIAGAPPPHRGELAVDPGRQGAQSSFGFTLTVSVAAMPL
jgi:hypothetical protein